MESFEYTPYVMDSGDFSQAHDEKLVEEITKYPELYDNKHRDYHDLVKKDALWKGIASELETEGAECKKRWRSLRDSYRRFQKDPKRNQPTNNRRKELFSQLSFLDEVECKRYDKNKRHIKRVKREPSSEPDSFRYQSQARKSTGGSKALTSTPIISRVVPEAPQKKTAIQYFILKPDTVRTALDPKEPQPPTDEIESFLSMMAHTIKKFSPQFQIEAKKRIFECVTEIELLNYQQSHCSSSKSLDSSENGT